MERPFLRHFEGQSQLFGRCSVVPRVSKYPMDDEAVPSCAQPAFHFAEIADLRQCGRNDQADDRIVFRRL